jgi:hypothetical protein
MCQRHGVPCRDAHVATVTKHFLGKGRWAGGRAARKNAIVRRCQVLGYFGLDCRDDDRADACAVWDWASVTLARVPPREIRLFGDRAA